MKIIGIVLLCIIALIVIFVIWASLKPSVPKNYTETVKTGGEIEAKYLKNGSHEVEYFEQGTMQNFKKYEVWYPADMKNSDNLYPVIVVSNGTGVKASKCKAIFEHFASWGFIIIGTEEEYSWNGFSACCGGFFGSKVWHSTSKYRRVIWQCNHKFKNGEKCTTPHLYEDVIKEKFVQVCGMVGEYKEDFLRSCRQIVDMLSDCSAFDKQIGNLQIRADELTAVMQAFIKDNAENAQDQKLYSQRFAEYEKQ